MVFVLSVLICSYINVDSRCGKLVAVGRLNSLQYLVLCEKWLLSGV